ncbi:MAG: pseudouridine synthase [Acidimicrobiia bacterium]
MIKAGRVTVDGQPAHLGQKIDPEAAHVEIDGVPLPVRPGLVYYLLNKPRGVVSTVSDPQRRPTVVAMVPDRPRVHPAGRLDADSEGLMLLTNDGALTDLVTHPHYGITKTYVARVEGSPAPATLRALAEGVELEDGPARARAVRLIDDRGAEALVELVMGEGRKREVRRMLQAVGHPVTRLVRTAIGPISDRRLKPGQWRRLTPDEVRALYAAAAVG